MSKQTPFNEFEDTHRDAVSAMASHAAELHKEAHALRRIGLTGLADRMDGWSEGLGAIVRECGRATERMCRDRNAHPGRYG